MSLSRNGILSKWAKFTQGWSRFVLGVFVIVVAVAEEVKWPLERQDLCPTEFTGTFSFCCCSVSS